MKKFLSTISLLFALCSPAWSMVTPFTMATNGGGPSASAVEYMPISGQGSTGLPQTTESVVSQISTISGTFQNFYIRLNQSPDNGGGTQSYTYVLYVNGAPTAVTCTISEAETSCFDITHTASITAGQTVSLESTPSGTPTQRDVHFTIELSAAANSSTIMVAAMTGNPSTGSNNFSPLQGATGWNATESARSQVFPTAGNITHIEVALSVAPDNGAGTDEYILTLMVDGAATSLTCTVQEAALTCSASVTVAITAGQTVSMRSDPNNTPASTTIKYSVTFEPTIDGEAVTMWGGTGLPSTTVAHSTGMSGFFSSATSASAMDTTTPTTTVKKLYVRIGTAPGGAATWTINFDGSEDDITCQIADPAVACNDTSNTEVMTASNLTSISWRVTPAGTPAAPTTFRVGGVFYTAPTSTHIKSVDGVVQAQIKSTNGVPIAHTKSVEGVTNV